jgi:acetyltransferase-like isoleucine patch superfamily enzyme
MRKQLNKIISRLKGRGYEIDERIPSRYLFSLALSRGIMRVRGFFSRVENGGMLFVGKNVTLKARTMIRVGRGVTIHDGSYIDALSTEGIFFGNNVSAGRNTRIECTGNLQVIGKGMKAGNNVGLGSDNFFGAAGGIEIGDDCILGNFISFHSENHKYNDPSVPIRLQGVTRTGISVGKNCWIGSKAMILDGAVIGNGCIIAAGSVVKAGIYEEDGIYGGIPAKFIRKRYG